ncbi:hypothetical protein GCM10011313_28270 [Mycetocola zhadangensis]|nr:hypothetical protein GCM10011313_28270 [Mycetocola zhadangensis]
MPRLTEHARVPGGLTPEGMRTRVNALADVRLHLGDAHPDGAVLGRVTEDGTEQVRRDLDGRPFKERAIEHG